MQPKRPLASVLTLPALAARPPRVPVIPRAPYISSPPTHPTYIPPGESLRLSIAPYRSPVLFAHVDSWLKIELRGTLQCCRNSSSSPPPPTLSQRSDSRGDGGSVSMEAKCWLEGLTCLSIVKVFRMSCLCTLDGQTDRTVWKKRNYSVTVIPKRLFSDAAAN